MAQLDRLARAAGQAPQDETSEPARDGGWSLRLRLALTVIVALAPVAIVSVLQGVDRVRRDVDDVRERLIQTARAASSDEQNVLASAEQILRALANQPEVRDGSGALRRRRWPTALRGLAFFTNIARVDAQGPRLSAPPCRRPIAT